MIELLKWLNSHPLESLLLLFGIGMGIFYGFDGWRGSTEDVELKDSPRLKNFLYALSGAFGTFIADFKAIDPTAQKPKLMLVYLLGFCAAAAIVVIGWGLAILINAWCFKSGQGKTRSPFKQLTDYLFFGFKYHRKMLEKAEEESRTLRLSFYNAFLPEYLKQLSYSLAAVGSYIAAPNPQSKVIIGRDILRSVVAVVLEYHGKEADGLKLNSNYMVALASTEHAILQERLLSKPGKSSQYKWYLKLEAFATDEGTEVFTLPVPKKDDPNPGSVLLPGAPTAFFDNKTIVVDDTEKIQYSNKLDNAIIEGSKDYFRRKGFKSFASLNIVHGGRQIGILNVDSNQTCVFGESDADKTEIEQIVLPFCLILGYVLK